MIRYRLGGLLLVLAAAYLLLEAWAVAGWQGRDYRWTIDAISLLGVPERISARGDVADSTRHAWMNANFVTSGVRVILAGLLLSPFVPRRGRGLVLALVLVHGAGTIVVGLFPTGGGSLRADLHGLGAGMSIIGGAALLVALTLVLARRNPGSAIVTGICALTSVAGCLLVFGGTAPFGLVERVAVDAVILWQVGAGLLVLGSRAPATDTL